MKLAVWACGRSGTWGVPDQNRTALKPIRADELKIRATIQIFEQTLALVHDNRMNKYPILVDEPGIRKGLDERRTAKRNDVAAIS